MVLKKSRFPENGELVMATVVDVNPTHAYLLLDDYRGLDGDKPGRENLNVTDAIRYNAMAYMHISELANHWIKNIRDFVKEGQKLVVKVLKVDPRKGHIDLSRRRVSGQGKKETVKQWKQANKAEGLLKLIAEKFHVSLKEIYEKLGFPLEEAYGAIWSAFEDIKEQGIDAIMDLEFVEEVEDEWLEELEKIVEQNVDIPVVNIIGEFELVSYAPDGVSVIKKAIEAGKKIKPPKDSNITLEFQLLASPRYRMELIASDYQTAEIYLKKVESKILSTIKKLGGEGSFIR
ncbi:MAG: translation initiation factor IF-2 subunit alpha [Promethearchaeota archaeon]